MGAHITSQLRFSSVLCSNKCLCGSPVCATVTGHQESLQEDVSDSTKGFESDNDCSDHDDHDAGGDDAEDGNDDDSDSTIAWAVSNIVV